MPRRMVLVSADSGASPVLEEVAAHDEFQLQRRLTENPDLIPIEEFGWAGPLLVVGRETSLPSGSVDLIAVARGGEILIAEFKTGPENPDFRHALAQAIDYGADLWRLTLEQFDAAVAARYFGSDHCPGTSPTKNCTSVLRAAEIVWHEAWSDEERSQFPANLADGLRTGKLHYAVVAQRFTPAMERTAEYLNANGGNARFYLVELIRFSNGAIDAFEARTVVKPQPSRSGATSNSTKLNAATFLESEPDEHRRDRLDHFLEFCTGLGLSVFWGTSGISVRMPTPDGPELLSVAWIHPSGVVGWMGLTGMALGYDTGSASSHPTLKEPLNIYVSALQSLSGATPAKAKNIAAAVFGPDAEAKHIAAIEERIASLVEASASAGTPQAV
jgi:hypothetical protein